MIGQVDQKENQKLLQRGKRNQRIISRLQREPSDEEEESAAVITEDAH